jgi:hypothetical protein
MRRIAVPGLMEPIGFNGLDAMSMPLYMTGYAGSLGEGGTCDWGALRVHKSSEAIGSSSP